MEEERIRSLEQKEKFEREYVEFVKREKLRKKKEFRRKILEVRSRKVLEALQESKDFLEVVPEEIEASDQDDEEFEGEWVEELRRDIQRRYEIRKELFRNNLCIASTDK